MVSIQRKVDGFSVHLVLLLGTCAALIASFFVYVHAEKQIDAANESREESLRISDQLRQSSLDLTSMARAYVTTGATHYRDHYLSILAVREGREPRPADIRNEYWELHEPGDDSHATSDEQVSLVALARSAGFTAEEQRLLERAKAQSDELAQVEMRAFEAVSSSTPHSEARVTAIRSLYDENYRRARAGVMQPIAEVDRMVDRRTQARVQQATQRAYQMRVVVILLGALQILLLWGIHRQLHNILGGSVRDVFSRIQRLGRGDFAAEPVPAGQGDSVLGWVADSSRQLARLELRQFKAIVESSDDAIISKTPQGIITSWNPGAQRIFGYTAAEAVGQSMELLIPGECGDEESRILERLARGEMLAGFETRRRRKDGTVIDVSATISPIRDESGVVVGMTKIARDVTLLKQLAAELVRHRDNLGREVEARTAELRLAMQSAEDANRAKNTFLATTSHELRTPLNAIIGFSSLLRDGLMGEVTEQQHKALEIVHQAGEDLLVLVQEILDLSAIEAGNLQVAREQVPLRTVLEDVCESFTVQAQDQGLQMRSVVCDPQVAVWGDRARLAQVVRNFLGNAIKFTDRGYVLVRAVQDGDAMRVEVEDSGIGIPLAEQHRLFQSFQRVIDPHGRIRAGTGLGLSICKRIVEAMGGGVGVDSVPGRGSRFWFTVPIATAAPTTTHA